MKFQVTIPQFQDPNKARQYATLENLAQTLGIANQEDISIQANRDAYTQDGKWLKAGSSVTVNINQGLWKYVANNAFNTNFQADDIPTLLGLDIRSVHTTAEAPFGYELFAETKAEEALLSHIENTALAPHVCVFSRENDSLISSLMFYNSENDLSQAHAMHLEDTKPEDAVVDVVPAKPLFETNPYDFPTNLHASNDFEVFYENLLDAELDIDLDEPQDFADSTPVHWSDETIALARELNEYSADLFQINDFSNTNDALLNLQDRLQERMQARRKAAATSALWDSEDSLSTTGSSFSGNNTDTTRTTLTPAH